MHPLAPAARRGRIRRWLALLAVAVTAGSLAACTASGDTRPARPASPATAGPWLIDHLTGEEDASTALERYVAFCAPPDAFSPTGGPAADELVPVAITAADFSRLRPGSPCPADLRGTR
ncbi:hypothetical protein SAMN04489729_4245 [Amycolatopsis lurida]|uniref:Uncharacterized protein n=1 Tax=Amycolatopsis lurida NRRL 2430 TaxID=1460371 RepID=A0A2P2G1T4_AMYLU|nr:hypothetical protein [Amycolatopsis lurida]KFU82925.1 hypothetical protein BB31_00085 [Amycolatopsis lurida NRRL 2430]SED40167.1 hypothetical protein SAMN04489729_4245 [Amycolatopsis lurida]